MRLAILKAKITEDERCDMTFEPFELDETKDELRQFYNAINCDVIDYQTIEIDGHVYDCICDDEGLLKPEPIPMLWTGDNILVGNIIFANVNKEGETVPLSTDDYYRISDYIRGWNIKMLNAYIRGQRKKRKQKLFDF